MRIVMRHFRIVLAVALVFALGVSARANFMVDDFGAPAVIQVPVIALLNADPVVIETPGGMVGGERDLLLDVIGTPSFSSFIGEIGAGRLVFASSSPGTAATIQYDGIDADPAAALVNSETLGGGNATLVGDRFLLDFQSIDGGGAQTTDIEIEVHSAASSGTFSGAIPDSAGPSTFVARFSDFSDPSVFTAVTSVEFRINASGADDVDFALDAIRIPEPSTLAMAVLGLASLLAWAWSRRK